MQRTISPARRSMPSPLAANRWPRRPAVAGLVAFVLVHVAGYASPLHGADAGIDQALEEGTLEQANLSEGVDFWLDRRLEEEQIVAAAPADDAEFIRRASLDLCGVVPLPAEILDFLRDTAPDKRARAVDRMLASPRYASHMANWWSGMLLPSDAQIERFEQVRAFSRWLRRRFAENTRYDNLVADLLTTTGVGEQAGAVLFFTAADLKPEELAASTSRIFLGVQIQCAQCHNHPYDHWKQNDFWSFAAFFARLQQSGGARPMDMGLVDVASGEVTLPGTTEVMLPKYLGAEPPSFDADSNRRRQLAIWTVSRDNPYFARVAVNRAWAQLFGRGLVHPIDDFGAHNPASHPELLDELSSWFIDSGYDFRALMRGLALSKAYGRTSQMLSAESSPHELFGIMPVKTLTPDQLYDSLIRATRYTYVPPQPMQLPFSAADLARQQFVSRFNMAAKEATEFEAGIPQVLALMNGPLVTAASDPASSGILQALAAPIFSDRERVEMLFLASVSRLPADAERDQFVAYVENGGPTGDRGKALGDVLWALLNSPEFILNH